MPHHFWLGQAHNDITFISLLIDSFSASFLFWFNQDSLDPKPPPHHVTICLPSLGLRHAFVTHGRTKRGNHILRPAAVFYPFGHPTPYVYVVTSPVTSSDVKWRRTMTTSDTKLPGSRATCQARDSFDHDTKKHLSVSRGRVPCLRMSDDVSRITSREVI
jgi:hypothetical protein